MAGDRALGHYGHEKDPVACRAALSTIEYIEIHNLVDYVREPGRYALSDMTDMMRGIP